MYSISLAIAISLSLCGTNGLSLALSSWTNKRIVVDCCCCANIPRTWAICSVLIQHEHACALNIFLRACDGHACTDPYSSDIFLHACAGHACTDPYSIPRTKVFCSRTHLQYSSVPDDARIRLPCNLSNYYAIPVFVTLSYYIYYYTGFLAKYALVTGFPSVGCWELCCTPP